MRKLSPLTRSTSDLPDRKTLRKPRYAYDQPGAYFITVLADQRGSGVFGTVDRITVRLNETGRIVQSTWWNLATTCPWVVPAECVIMPDHVHGIVRILDCTDLEAGRLTGAMEVRMEEGDHKDRPYPAKPAVGTLPRSLGRAVQSFKSLSANANRRPAVDMGLPRTTRLWHRNYYHRLIQSPEEDHRAVRYMRENPRRWSQKHC